MRLDILVYLYKGVVCVQMFVWPSCFMSHGPWAIWKFWGPFGDIAVFMESRGLGQRIPIMIRNWNPSQKPPQSSITPTKYFEDMRILCTLIFNVESWISENRLFGTFLAPPHHDQEPKSQSGTSRVLHNSRPGLQGHGVSLHLFIQCRKLNFGK